MTDTCVLPSTLKIELRSYLLITLTLSEEQGVSPEERVEANNERLTTMKTLPFLCP